MRKLAGASRVTGRIGGGLLVASLLVGLVGLAVSGSTAFGTLSPDAMGGIAVLLFAGVGALLVALEPRGPLGGRLVRLSLGGFGLGALLLVGASVRSAMVTGEAMGDFLAMSLLLVGAVVLVAGLLGTIAALAARRTALGLGAAITILAGLVAVVPMTAWVSADLGIVGMALVLCGLAAIGLIALGIGAPDHPTVSGWRGGEAR